jgi:hypothetical protein
MLNESDGVLLLFARGINIGKKKRNIMTADEGHKASVIVVLSAGLFFATICSLVRILTLVNGSVRNLCLIFPRRPLSGLFNTISYYIHLRLRYEIIRVIE